MRNRYFMREYPILSKFSFQMLIKKYCDKELLIFNI